MQDEAPIGENAASLRALFDLTASTPRYALYGLFTLSGFCGLIYESIWSHYLRNYLGHAAHGQTVVLVIFVGGLALGAWLAGRYSERVREPLLAYAGAEVFVGLFAFLFHPLFVGVTGWSYDALLPRVCGATGVCATQWIIAALLIALPAIALGATFPWMVAGVLRRYRERPGHEVSVLYFLNSLGAVVGVLASAFVLIPWLGLPATLATAGALNVAIGVAVFLIARATRPLAVSVELPEEIAETPRPESTKRKKSSAPPQAPRWSAPLVVVFLGVAALTGLSSFIYEIVWIRMLSMVLGASTHAFELMLAAFILGLAAGGAWIRNRIDGIADARAYLGHVQIIMGIAALLTLPLYHSLFDALAWLLTGLNRSFSGYWLFHVASAALALVVMLPATFFAGMTLPLITRRLLDEKSGERAIGFVYAANTGGAIVGVIVAVHLLIPLAGLKTALVAGAAIDIGLGIYLLRRPRGELAFSWPGFAMVIAGLGVIGVVAAGFSIDPKRAASGVYREGYARISADAKVLFHADGKTATVTVVEINGLRMLRTNGKTDASMALDGTAATRGDEPTQALLGALPVAAHPKAKRAAVIGIGSGITSTALLAAPSLERLDTIEIEPRMVDGAKFFSERNAALFSDPRSHFVVDDAKSWLARATEPYDIIVSEPSNPWVSGVASLFTIETYERIAKHLARGGVLVQWIQMYEIDEALLSSIFRAMVAHFPHYVVHVVGTTDLIVVASKEQRPRVEASTLFNLPGMAKLLRQSGFASPAAIDATWRGDNTTVDVLMSAFDAPVNSDYRPYVDVHAARARFVRASVDRLFGAPVAPSMLDLLGGQRAPGDGDDVLAVALGEALVAAPEGSVALPDAHKAYADALRASRELLRTCKPGGLPAVLLEGAIGTAMVINDQRDLGRAQNVWAVVRKGDCYRSLPPELKDWVNLFAAVASRDAPAMADLGSRLVASAPHEFARDYALNAAVVGEIAQGRAEFGGRLLELHAGDRDSVWLTTLRQATSKRTIARR